MNERQARFVREYLLDRNGAAAAVRAGYSARTAKQIAHELLTKPDLADAVGAGEARLEAKVELDREKVLAGLMEAVEVARVERDAGAMVRAWSEVAKMLGYYAPERAISLHANVAMKRFVDQLETLPDAELAALANAGEPCAERSER